MRHGEKFLKLNSGSARSNRSALKPATAQAAGDRGDGNGACDDLLHRDVVHHAHLDVRDAHTIGSGQVRFGRVGGVAIERA